ncbi:MAG: ABC transporter permease [Longimicrobiales bacterium]
MPPVLRQMADTVRDVRGAIRVSMRERTNSLAVVLTIGLGLGAATAIISVVRPALLQPLPYADGDRLVHIWEQPIGSSEHGRASYPTLLDWRAASTAFVGLEAYDGTNVAALIGDQAEMLSGARVTPGFFELLGVQPLLGRSVLEDEQDGGIDPVVVSHRLARRLGERSALGRSVTLNGELHTVIGVLPPSFHFGEDADIWLPLAMGEARRTDRSLRWLNVIGRLREDVDLSSAQIDLAGVTSILAVDHPADMEGRTVAVSPLRDVFLGNVKPILVSLMAAVGLVLVITVANLAALMLLRNLNRRNELALRAALGAWHGRLVRQLFVEGLVLAIAGALLGFYVGRIGIGLMLREIPGSVKVAMQLADVGLDIATVSAIFVIATIMAAAFALGPAWRAVRAIEPVGHGTRLTVGRADRRLRRILVAAQLGLTVVLLTGTAQLAASLVNLLRREIGVVAPDQLLTLNLAPSGSAYDEAAAQRAFYEELVTRAAALPGVLGAAAVSELPLGGSGMTPFEIVDRPAPPGQRPEVAMRMFAGDYFGTLGVPLRDGRLVGARDRVGTTPAVVVSASLADRISGDGRSLLGRRIRLGRTGDTAWEIVGVVGDVQMGRLDAEAPPTVYVSHLQASDNRLPLVVRTSAPAAVAASLRELIRAIDPSIPVYSVGTLGEQMRGSWAVFARTFPLVIGAVFAGAALLLAVVGLYSLCAHEVLSRRREFAIRIVLGASPTGVRFAVLRDGLVLTLVGVLGGVLAAVPASRLVRSLLFAVQAVDPYIYGGVAVGVVAAATLATALPAWRDSAENLVAALRSE